MSVAEAAPDRGGWPLRRSMTVLGAVILVVALATIGSAGLAIYDLGDARHRVNQREPAARYALALSAALVNEETGVRGYLLSLRPDFLQPYRAGRAAEQVAVTNLARLTSGQLAEFQSDLTEVRDRARRWQSEYAEPVIAAVRLGRNPPVPEQLGKQLFDALRGALDRQQNQLDNAVRQARDDQATVARYLLWVYVAIATGLVGMIVVLALGVRRVVTAPLSRLATEVRMVASGDFTSPVRVTGPREVVELGEDVDSMRRRILVELSALRTAHERLDEQARDLRRSNTELEQFAYVASHDLQEPLRKVASFSQLLARRYSGQLDERADQYIEFAVDGAKRMQVLINDLLAFSRVGRLTREHTVVDLRAVVDQAIANLSIVIEETGAEITVDDPLPAVRGDGTLLTGVFQNLISNAIKFRGADPPRIQVTVREDREFWLLAVHDNGIGIEREYAERIFVIFQRLHAKDAYPGTGIGLAMCRKIIEYHGGRIWLNTDPAEGQPDGDGESKQGTTFCFTLPKLSQPPELTSDETGIVNDGVRTERG